MNVDANILASLHLQYPQVRSINSNLNLKMIGLSSLNDLSEFTGVKCLDASHNVLEFVDPGHLAPMSGLRILKLQHNKLTQVPALFSNSHLHTLDLSSNLVSCVSNLSCLPSLHTLLLSNNRLSNAESLQDLTNCIPLETLEINSNMVTDRDVLTLMAGLPSLKWLQMRSNPLAATLLPYRKTIVGTITQLVELDGEAVEERERFFAAAFVSGGVDAEKGAREAFLLKNKERDRRNREFLRSQLSSRRIPLTPRPATLDDFHGITVFGAQQSEAVCGICMQVLSDQCARLSCQHEFHSECALRWLTCSLHSQVRRGLGRSGCCRC